MFVIAVIVLLLVSFLLALFSLRRELRRPKEIQIAKDELMKEKVLFIKD
jgi:hypothetical protein